MAKVEWKDGRCFIDGEDAGQIGKRVAELKGQPLKPEFTINGSMRGKSTPDAPIVFLPNTDGAG